MEQLKKWADTPSRLLTISIGAPTVFYIMYLGGAAYSALVFAVSMLCAIELQRMVFRNNLAIIPILLASTAIVCAILGLFTYFAVLLIVLLAMLFIGWLVSRYSENRHALYLKLAGVTIGAIYVCLPLAILLDIRQMPDGLGWTYLLFVNNWATDAFALVGGRFFGRKKLAPVISSGKTREGAFIGFVVGIVGGMIVAGIFDLPLVQSFIVNCVIAFLTITGDLIESIFKRYYGIKDTSGLLPGHGGFLDRVDGLVLAIVPLYAFMLLS